MAHDGSNVWSLLAGLTDCPATLGRTSNLHTSRTAAKPVLAVAFVQGMNRMQREVEF